MSDTNNPPTPAQTPALPDGIVLKDGQTFVKTVVSGTETLVPLAEAQARLQKESASEGRFAEAARLRDEAEKAKRDAALAQEFLDAARRGEKGDETAAKRALEILGVSAEQATSGPKQPAQGVPQAAELPPALKQYQTFADGCVQAGVDPIRVLNKVLTDVVESDRNEVYGNVVGLAQLNDVLAPILKGKNKDVAAVVTQELKDMTRLRVGLDGHKVDPSTYLTIVRETAEKYKKFGIPSSGNSPVPATFPGLGANTQSGVVGGDLDVTDPKQLNPLSSIVGGLDKFSQRFTQRFNFLKKQKEATQD